MKKFRNRKMNILLYPEDATHMKALDLISKSYDYASILHDKDVDEDGVIKKEHYHVVVNFGSNARWNTAVADELGLELNYIQECRSIDRSLEYLIHFNEPDKYQYDLEEVNGTLKSKLKQLVNVTGKTESDKVCELIEWIEQYNGIITLKTFSKYCASVGMWDVFRRSGVIFIKMIEEHNQEYLNDRELVR